MKYILLILFTVVFLSTISASDKIEKDEWAEYYKAYNTEGCFILYNMNEDKYYIYNQKRTDEGFLPASTFKIPNSLIGLETGAVNDENEIFKWDSSIVARVESWRQDHNMRSAIKVSCVWFYQEIARRVGQKRMQHFMDTIGYGNRNIGDKIDEFWLSGKMRITPVQQIDFLKRLYHNNLPFSQRSIDIVKDIMITEKTNKYILRSKTGWSDNGIIGNGWWIGYIERDNNVYFFVNNMDINKPEDAAGRIEISKNILRSMNLVK